jgi:hypothetical protein
MYQRSLLGAKAKVTKTFYMNMNAIPPLLSLFLIQFVNATKSKEIDAARMKCNRR